MIYLYIKVRVQDELRRTKCRVSENKECWMKMAFVLEPYHIKKSLKEACRPLYQSQAPSSLLFLLPTLCLFIIVCVCMCDLGHHVLLTSPL